MKYNLATFKVVAPLLGSYAVLWAAEPLTRAAQKAPDDFLSNSVWVRLPFVACAFFGLWCDYKKLKKVDALAPIAVQPPRKLK
jgi:hypothetical protein